MLSIDKVLFPVDFSEGCRSALARNLQSALIVMHAVPARAAAAAHGSSESYYAPLALSGNDPQYKLDALLQSTSISAEATIKRGSRRKRSYARRSAPARLCWSSDVEAAPASRMAWMLENSQKDLRARLSSARGNPPRQCVFGLNGSRKSMPGKRAHLRILFLS